MNPCLIIQSVSVLKAGEEGYVNTFIVCPPLVYGPGTGPIAKTSLVYKFFMNSILTFGRGYVIGQGTNIIDVVCLVQFQYSILSLMRPRFTSAILLYC